MQPSIVCEWYCLLEAAFECPAEVCLLINLSQFINVKVRLYKLHRTHLVALVTGIKTRSFDCEICDDANNYNQGSPPLISLIGHVYNKNIYSLLVVTHDLAYCSISLLMLHCREGKISNADCE